MNYIDTHCHLNDEALYPYRDEIINRAKNSGCKALFNNGDSLPSFSRILSIQQEYPDFCYSVLGIHPEFATQSEEYQKEAFDFVLDHREEIKAIGEIGLDYHYDKDEETKKKQKGLFREWIRLAKKLNLPIVVHARDASQDTFEIIKEELPGKVDLHCYSSSYELYREYLKLPIQFHIGIGGVLTFKNAKVLKEVVSEGDLSSFLTETDSPYLAQVPHRGERNEPSYIPLVIQEIARIKEIDEEEVAKTLYENGKQFYGIE